MAASRAKLGTIRSLARLARVSQNSQTDGRILLQRCSQSATKSSNVLFSNQAVNKSLLTSQIKSRFQTQFLSPICLQIIAGLGNTPLIDLNHDVQTGVSSDDGEGDDEGQQIPLP